MSASGFERLYGDHGGSGSGAGVALSTKPVSDCLCVTVFRLMSGMGDDVSGDPTARSDAEDEGP